MPFIFDTTFFVELSSHNPLMIMWILFVKGGWVAFAILFIYLFGWLRLLRLQDKYYSGIEYILLAIDVPKNSEQTPKAMEQVFATISGAHQDINSRAKYFEGEIQLQFSFEIVSIDGYIQFLVWTPKVYRDLVEASIYSQYPDAEIAEVEDYTKDIPNYYPNDQYKIWGSELMLVKPEAYPIRTYRYFEDQLSQELKDPLASVIETMSRIQKNEQVWLQIIVTPTENQEWVARVLKEAYKVAGKKRPSESKKGILSPLFDSLHNFPNWFSWTRTDTITSKADEKFDLGAMKLTPGERTIVEGIENKASKVGFLCKLRLIYLSPPEQYQSARVVNSVFGSIKQFNDLTSNSLKPNKKTKTSVTWMFVNRRVNARRRRIMINYKARSWYRGRRSYILNAEELATLYHFPALAVTSPNLKRTETKKSDAPAHLPAGAEDTTENSEAKMRQQLVNLNLDNDYFEKRYAKYRTGTQRKQESGTQPSVKSPDNIPDNLPLSQ